MLVHHRVIPSIKFPGIHLYTWVKRGTVKVKCLAQEHSAMSMARARTRTAPSGHEHTNHEATFTSGACQICKLVPCIQCTCTMHSGDAKSDTWVWCLGTTFGSLKLPLQSQKYPLKDVDYIHLKLCGKRPRIILQNSRTATIRPW